MNAAYQKLNEVSFPSPTGIMINMMPIIMGDRKSYPDFISGYESMIEQCNLEKGSTVYLTVHESRPSPNKTQRRPGVHVEAPMHMGWGGGWGGIDKGLFMASTDGKCRVWNTLHPERGEHGGIHRNALRASQSEVMAPSTLYWLTDQTPHEALPSELGTIRQFFRLVSEDVSVWFKSHNTPNPLGVRPKCPITTIDKFGD